MAGRIGLINTIWLSGLLLAAGYMAAPFLVAGGLKIVYDLLLYRSFRAMQPPEEQMGSHSR